MNDVDELLKIMDRLRDPQSGCPWDLQQTNTTILPYTLEEIYELAEAISDNDNAAIKDELGDLLFQIMFYSRMASEAGHFSFGDVVRNISEKLVRRHPHVFGESNIHTADEQSISWEQIKQRERESAGQTDTGLLDNISSAMPALICAMKLQKKAASVGFDWGQPEPVMDKIREELDEIREVMDEGAEQTRLREEVGDLLFACANLARHLKVDPEYALMGANRKFRQRFGHIESQLTRQGRSLEEADLDEMEALWQEAKLVRSEE
ncbi:MAG: nucleoside triphosphate pyrophosphohydrolase [Pseudomonadales bacterium]